MTTRLGLILILAAGCSDPAPREDVEPLFHALEKGTPAEAMEASGKLAAAYDDSLRPRLEKALTVAPVRALQLIGDLYTEGSADVLLEHLPYLLEGGQREVARMAAVAAGLRRLKAATHALLEQTEEPAAVRALGRIWTQPLDAPALPRREEIDRLTVLAVAHRQAMGGGATVEACEAMLSIMTRAELEDFLGKHAGAKFLARHLCDEAVRHRGFDPAKGVLIHEALLSSPDVELVAGILATSPYPLREELVAGFLKDERVVKDGVRLRDVAAKRLKR